MLQKEMVELTQAFLGVSRTVAAVAVSKSWPPGKERVTAGRLPGIARKITAHIASDTPKMIPALQDGCECGRDASLMAWGVPWCQACHLAELEGGASEF